LEFIQGFLFTSKYLMGRNGNFDIYYLFSAFTICFYFWKRRNKTLLIAKICAPFAIIIAIMAFAYPWSDKIRCLIFFLKIILDVTLMVFVACNCKKWKIGRFANTVVWIQGIETIIALIMRNSSLWVTENLINGAKGISRLRLFYLDPGTMAFASGLTMVILVYLIITDDVVWHYVIGICVMCLDLFLSFGVGGITCALVAIGLMLVITAFSNFKEHKEKIIKKATIGVIAVAGVIVTIFSTNSTYLNRIKAIINGTDYILSVKIINPLMTLENVLKTTHFLGIGYGNGNTRFALDLINSEKAYPNSFIRIIAEGGIFGIILICIVILGLGYYVIRYGGVVDKALYLYIIIYQMIGGYFTDPTTFFIYGWIVGDCLNRKVSIKGCCKIDFFNPAIIEHLSIAQIGHKRVPSREGGVEIVVEELSKRMVQKGHKVDAYNRSGQHISGSEFNVVDYNNLKEYEGIKIITIPTIQRKGLAAFIYSLIASVEVIGKDYDVVHYHAEGPCFFMWIPSLFGIRTVCTIHGLDWQRSAKWGSIGSTVIRLGEKAAVLFADEMIVLSKHVQQYFLETYSRKTKLIPNGVNKPEKRKPEIIRTKWGLNTNSYILALCRITREKKIDLLIEAFKKIDTDKRLVIAGGSSDSDAYVEELHKLAESDSRIIFTGFVQGQELEELYSNSYLYVLPSELEGMPLSLMEAMSYGNCCLTSDISENTDVIRSKGVSFETNNVEDLIRTLIELIDDMDKVSKLQNEASEYICSRYNWDDVVNRTIRLYSQI